MSFLKKFTSRVTAPDASVQLKLNSFSVGAGQNLIGTLSVSSKEDFDSTEVRCEIECVEQFKTIKQEYDLTLKISVPREVQESSVLFASKPTLCGATHFGQGENRDFPVNINIPAGVRPSYVSAQDRITWTAKGVVAVHGRPDIVTKNMEIQVTQPTVQSTVTEKEIVREVVLIPCKYCGTLMDQTVTICPNCGGKRTV